MFDNMDNWLRGTFSGVTHWFVVAQVFGFITMLCALLLYQAKNQRIFLKWHIITNFFWAIMFFLLGDFMGILLAVFGILRSGMFLYMLDKTSRRAKITARVTLIVALAIGITAIAIRDDRWWDWVIVATAVFFVIGTYLPGKHLLRIAALLYSAALIVHNAPLPGTWYDGVYTRGAFNFMAIAIESVAIFSVLIFYAKIVAKQWISEDFAKRKDVEKNKPTLAVTKVNLVDIQNIAKETSTEAQTEEATSPVVDDTKDTESPKEITGNPDENNDNKNS